jgi:hypothetical protein
VAQSPATPSAPATSLSPAQLDRVGKRIWQNECAGTIDGLTSWNTGEDFASLGIGHFIWYPAGRRGPFEESFPRLIAYLGQRGINAPAWMQGPCLWNDRASFLAEQTEFIRIRSRAALPKMLAAAGPNANRVRYHFDLLSATPEGTFALIDYVNFKGEGTAPAERYQGRGWGLLQVLENMTARTPADAPAAFADSASRVLTQRVQLSPPDRGESRWLPGWKNRCQTYKQPL